MNKKNVRLSIIIPSFQQGAYIKQALLSISEQNFSDYEILIIDAESKDDTASQVAAFIYLPIIFVQASDKGVYDAMNKGIKLAKGEWIYFMGCDDRIYDNNVLDDLSNYFADNAIDILYGDVVLTSDSSRYAGQFDIDRLLRSANICHQAIFYRRSVFDKLGFYNLKYKIWADWDFNIRCFKHTELVITYVDRVIAFYNNESGVSSTYDKALSEELPLFFINKVNSLENQNLGLLSSTSFRIGNFVVSFLVKIRRLLSFGR